MTESVQIIAAEQLLQRIDKAPFSGPLLDVAPDRRTRVVGLEERDIPAVMTLLERVYGHYENVTARMSDDSSLEIDVAPLAPDETWRSAQRLHTIIAYLRSPNGCPWDRAQDWRSLAPKVVEEAYEVVDAIEDADPAELAGELGDLLLIVALLTQIGEERGDFTIEDVYELVNRKLIRRHPHVFGDDAADTPEAVLSTWQRVKREERGETAKPRTKYDRLPRSMPGIAKLAAMLEDEPASMSIATLPENGDELLELIESMYAAGRDPEAELQAALDRKYSTT
ncbi:MAG TPA: MazG family protein [Thermomicrobiales bacterium]|nr:MazG family protein [Thermomicrobiales bacterium]